MEWKTYLTQSRTLTGEAELLERHLIRYQGCQLQALVETFDVHMQDLQGYQIDDPEITLHTALPGSQMEVSELCKASPASGHCYGPTLPHAQLSAR